MTDLADLPWDNPESKPTRNGAKGRPGKPYGTPPDPVRSDTGRRAAKRGKAIQRERIEGLGGMNLAGNNPNLDGIGRGFRYESKSGKAFPERPWRWLKDVPLLAGDIGVLIITEAPGRGHKARSMVIVDYDDWAEIMRRIADRA
jgi:hypothetical protein